jgi:meso-butanediol dehydrogenase/(S,S)-butanediol dehydrogenase/diacetyl reductase
MAVERVAIVTGAASGIGRAAATLFAERGWGVVAVDIAADSLAWTDGHERIVALVGDVTSENDNAAAVAVAEDCWGRLDASFLNAGVAGSPPWESPEAATQLRRVLEVNVVGVALGIRAAAPALRRAGGGAIVATASTSGMRADPRSWCYNASKAAVINLVRAAAMDFASDDIRVNAVAPGPTDTGMTKGLQQHARVYDDMVGRIPQHRFGDPREIAEVAYFLASPQSSFVTGVTVPADGGISANAGHFPLPRNPAGWV